ncbi:aminotransferase class III-fold pyridoxal phosphate-dependent enzyme [Sneathiella sp. P13V-1]|uniref:aspartate aminotransferase family protein n=1 Tax=Sneathiella sp. P13V-1 TaxID=2697366 RepID=UPI00187B1235|nr:aspartate aminotransferase family protein [Sneathiella sp. P13V-1]MBE7637925.1 aminotransferase class III-fold pyridoxal phosphate-dependent enzyme [Sneathiella sp. P13V-1]
MSSPDLRQGNSLASRDVKNLIHSYTNLSVHEKTGPLIIEKGKGIYVYDDNGKEYIEGLAGLWCTSFGFGEQELIDAATKQMQKLPYYHSFASKSTEPGILLAEKLIEIAPADFSKVFFVNSGSEANDTVVKLIWYYNNALGRRQKKKIISRQKAYHGVTVAAASLTGLPPLHNDFDLPIENILHTSCPHYYRFGKDGESEEEFATRMAVELEELILKEGPDTVAAFIAEPVMGAGGVIVPPKGYFEKIQAVLKKYDVLMVADEVICGFGRTGNMWGTETYGIKPDILSCAKALSSAYLPIAAVMVSEEIFRGMVKQSETHGAFAHGYTYSGHPVPAAVALRTLELMEERNMIAHVQKVAPVFEKRFKALADHELVGEVRVSGLVGAIELVADKETKRSFAPSCAVGPTGYGYIQEEGVISRAVAGDNLALCPPLIITEEQINEMFDRFERGLERLAQDVNGNNWRDAK